MTDEQPPTGRDRVVDRVNELATTALDTLAMLSVSAGVAHMIRPRLGRGSGLVAGGLLLGALSLATQFVHRDRPAPPPRPRNTLPGPDDPGSLHVTGR